MKVRLVKLLFAQNAIVPEMFFENDGDKWTNDSFVTDCSAMTALVLAISRLEQPKAVAIAE